MMLQLGPLDLRHDGPLARLHERAISPPGRGRRRLFRRPAGPQFGANMQRYSSNTSAENDLTLTHGLINLQRSRTVSGMFNLAEDTALRVVRETDAGVVVRGARILATLGPLSDEIAVYSPRLGRYSEPHSPFAMSFSIPCGTPGMKLPVPRELRPWPFAFRPPARLALRGDGLRRRSSTTCWCRGSGCSSYGDVAPAQRHAPVEDALVRCTRRTRGRPRTSRNASSCSASRC